MRGCRRGDLPFHGAQHEVRRGTLRALPVRHACSFAATDRSSATTVCAICFGSRRSRWRPAIASPGSPSGSSPPAMAASSPCWIARMSCSRWPRRSRSPISRRRPGPRSRAATICRWSKARSPPRTMPSASTRSARRSRRLITIGACATAGGIQALRNFADVQRVRSRRLRSSGIHPHALDLDRRSPITCRWTSSSGLPNQQAAASRGVCRLPLRPAAVDPAA